MRVAILLVITAFFACNEASKQGTTAEKDAGILKAPYAPAFYDSLQLTMDAYYDLTDGFSRENITYVNKWSGILQQHIDSLPLALLQMDTSRLTALHTTLSSISAELTGLQGEEKLEEKRAAFQMVSDMLYDIVQSTGLKGKTIYRQYCPMAFDDRGAYWMSNSNTKQNPYFGNGMLGCVEVTDSLKY
jgi:Cu(I)/Ag(I) efflux system membrane fusion protein